MAIPPHRAPGDIGHIGDHNDIVDVLAAQQADIASNSNSIISHTTGDDPHGDRAYANETFSPIDHTHDQAVQSVNGQTGEVSLAADDVGAVSAGVVGLPNGVAALDANGKVPSSQLPAGGGGTAVVTPRPALAVVYANGYPTGWRSDIDSLTFVCSGSGDQSEINSAISAVAAQGGGDVMLAGPQFNLSNSVLMRTGIWLRGGGFMTELRASTGFGEGMIRLADADVHMVTISDLFINGAGQAVHGVVIDNTGGNFGSKPTSSPDSAHVIEKLFIRAPGTSSFAGHGIVMRGVNQRASKVRTIRVLDARGCGVWIDNSPDSHYTDVECGASGNGGPSPSWSTSAPSGHGFFIRGGNNMLLSCKGWYSRGDGFVIASTNRTQLTNCQAQDNYGYGFELTGKSSLVGCHADSNGQANGSDGRGRAGFHLTTAGALVQGCMSYDRGQSWQQQYGFSVTSGCSRSLITGVTYGNAVGSVTGTPGAGTIVEVVADSNGK